jgi:hypothetical protein
LITKYEAIIYEKELRRITISTQLACFSSMEEMTIRLKEDISDLDEAAIACRFLIEFVVSQPPNGKLKINLATYDQLLALSSELIARGTQSDLDYYGLFTFRFELLQSGRLGFNRHEYIAKLSSFQYFNAKDTLLDAEIDFENFWKENQEETYFEEPLWLTQLNSSFFDEFGFTFFDISDFILTAAELLELPNSKEVKSLEISLFIIAITGMLEWDEEKVSKIFNFLILRPREDFLNPPEQFSNKDIYPWRFNRELSYLRRPFLITTSENKTFVSWGTRHLYSALQYLLLSAKTGRLKEKYRSEKMRRYIGQINSEKGELFNNEVYNTIAKMNDIIIKKKVKKIDGKRIGFPNRDLGDIDVMVFMKKKKQILALECKNLEIARNPYEMSRELEELFIDHGNKQSTISKHLDRVEWLENNIDFVLKHEEIESKKRWKVEGLLIVRSEMITPHFYESKIPVFTLREFVEKYF